MKQKLLLLKNSAEHLTKTKQYVLFFGVSALVLLGISAIVGMKVFGKESSKTEKSSANKSKEKRIKIESSGTSLNQQEIWIDRLEKERDLMKKRLEELEKLVTTLAQQNFRPSPPAFEGNVQETSFNASSAKNATGLNPAFLEERAKKRRRDRFF